MSFANMNVNMLVKMAQITKLLDMPHYASLRMQLLKPNKYPHLIHALKGMLMLLPQGKAFESLKNRLECSSLVFDARQDNADKAAAKPDAKIKDYVVTVISESPELFSLIDKDRIMEFLD